MRRMIVSMDIYSWVHYCSAMIMRNPDDFEVLIVRSQNEDPIINHEELCEEARYEQRKHDLFCIGKKLGVKKIYNLRYPKEDIDIEKLVMEIQLRVAFGAVCEIYYQRIRLLNDIFFEVGKKAENIDIYSYAGGGPISKEIRLTDEERRKKLDLCELMIGVSDSREQRTPPLLAEKFHEPLRFPLSL